jgi:hypothetical protein
MVRPQARHAKNGIDTVIYSGAGQRAEQDDFLSIWENFPEAI